MLTVKDDPAAILKLIDCPTLALNGLANPSRVFPEPVRPHTDGEVPGSWFSQATGLAQVADADVDVDADVDAARAAAAAVVADAAFCCPASDAADAATGAAISEPQISIEAMTATVRMLPRTVLPTTLSPAHVRTWPEGQGMQLSRRDGTTQQTTHGCLSARRGVSEISLQHTDNFLNTF